MILLVQPGGGLHLLLPSALVVLPLILLLLLWFCRCCLCLCWCCHWCWRCCLQHGWCCLWCWYHNFLYRSGRIRSQWRYLWRWCGAGAVGAVANGAASGARGAAFGNHCFCCLLHWWCCRWRWWCCRHCLWRHRFRCWCCRPFALVTLPSAAVAQPSLAPVAPLSAVLVVLLLLPPALLAVPAAASGPLRTKTASRPSSPSLPAKACRPILHECMYTQAQAMSPMTPFLSLDSRVQVAPRASNQERELLRGPLLPPSLVRYRVVTLTLACSGCPGRGQRERWGEGG